MGKVTDGLFAPLPIAKWRARLARLIAPSPIPRGQSRTYASAKSSRLTAGWYAPNNSADSELVTSLTQLRARSRALMRDAPYAKRIRTVIVNNVIGSGIGVQAAVESTRGNRMDRINDDIEAAWREWSCAEYCHTGGKLNFGDLERQLFAQIVEAGEIFVRVHLRSFGGSRVPLSLEIIEPERIADDFQTSPASGAVLRMGVEVDQFHRPIGFWVRQQHPSEFLANAASRAQITRIAADDIFHLHLVDRWPQTRGEPWLHSVARRLNDMDGYAEAEIVAARAAASYMGIIQTPEPDTAVDEATGKPADFELEPGAVKHLMPGEEFTAFSPNRPNPNMDPFMRMMLREVVAGAMTSYEAVSRDYSQSNYSSSRLALLDDRDTWRTLQAWFIRAFREPLHKIFMQQATLAGAIPALPAMLYGANPEKYNAVQFKPRGWSWVDPTKEVEAYIAAVKAGFMTVGDVIALTGSGRDREDVWTERAHELKQSEELDLTFDTTPVDPLDEAAASQPAPAPALEMEPEVQDAEDKARSRIKHLVVSALNNAALEGEARGRTDATAEAVLALANAVEQKQTVVNVAGPNINVETPAIRVDAPQITVQPPVVNVAAAVVRVPATVVNVAAAEAPVVNVAPPAVTVNVPEQAAPVVRVETAAPVINVETAPPVVNINMPPLRATRTIVEKHDDKGRIVSTRTEEV